MKKSLLLVLKQPYPLLQCLGGALKVLGALVVEMQSLIAAGHVIEQDYLEGRIHVN